MTSRDLLRLIVPRPVRNAIRRPKATALWFWRGVTYSSGKAQSVEIRDGWSLKCHPNSVSAFKTFHDDEDSSAELDAFQAHSRPGMILFDAGAHHGFFALAALHFGGPETKVVAIDASQDAVRFLRENVALNGGSDRVQAIEAAVGAEAGVHKMITAGAGGMNYFHGVDDDRPDATTVRQVTLDGLVESSGLIPTHVKIDIEGFEEEAIRGATHLLREHHPIIYLELHGDYIRHRHKDPVEVLHQLEELGYRRFLHHEKPISPSEAAQLHLARIVCLADA